MAASRQAVLCPAASGAAVSNFQLSVAKALKLDQSWLGRLPIPAKSDVRLWATSQRGKKQWQRVSAGDVLLFCKSKVVFAYANCIATVQNAELAQVAWGSREWEYLFLLAEPHFVSVDLARVNAELGYSPKYNLRQLIVVPPQRSEPLLALVGAV